MPSIFIYGPSGQGKTTSIRNLNPKETAIINCDRKDLPLKGWKKSYMTHYNNEGKPDLSKSNYVETDKPKSVLKTLQTWNNRPDIKYIVIDTITHMMGAEFMRHALERGYDKFTNLGVDTNDVLSAIRSSTKNIAVFAHSDEVRNSDGISITKVRSFGKLVDEKIEIPSLFTTVLFPIVYRKDEEVKYLFQTQSNGTNYAKSPVGFDGDKTETALPFEMDNDVKKVFDLLLKFES